MDNWIIGNKAGLLAYIIAVSLFSASKFDAWHVLIALIYICINVPIPILKRTEPRLLLIALSAAFTIVCSYWLIPAFILLLPINLYELAWMVNKKKIAFALALLAPIPLVPSSLIAVYLLAAFLSLLVHAGGHASIEKMLRLQNERETMRADIQKLSRSLNENKEYMRQSEYTIKLEERNRVSQQIHDDIGHSMAGALIQMEASKRLLGTDPDKAATLLRNAISISKEGLERIRLTLRDIKPKSQELGINRLRLIVDDLSVKTALRATLSHEGNMDAITPIQWKIIQENAMESITNSLKYGQATGIHIEVHVLNKFIKAVVTDNGIGTDKVIKGLGIAGMEERAAAAGGTVIVDGTKGFSVTTLLPVGRG
ncbi:sensor histidine kinase [Cohnella herbarum]|uniref:histidine kinase n=1 Tax=Cohnella herbarum TaxID=2728023 RepID=A0A7Z2ZNU6_9BACL|nr:sensor histidine kinase [Cohnella herbarum]QJD86180.1 sensor histidine kinase [Cohnella herbarum]